MLRASINCWQNLTEFGQLFPADQCSWVTSRCTMHFVNVFDCILCLVTYCHHHNMYGFVSRAVQVMHLSKSGRGVQHFFRSQGYDREPELYTMYTCFAGSPQVSSVSAQWAQIHKSNLRQTGEAYGAGWGYFPSPVTLWPLTIRIITAASCSDEVNGLS